MNQNKQQEIQNTIDNPITQSMKPWQKALESAIGKPWQKKVDSNQITTWLDKWEGKLAEKRKPKI